MCLYLCNMSVVFVQDLCNIDEVFVKYLCQMNVVRVWQWCGMCVVCVCVSVCRLWIVFVLSLRSIYDMCV